MTSEGLLPSGGDITQERATSAPIRHRDASTVPFIDTIDVLLAAGPVVVAGLGLTVTQRVLGDSTPAPVLLARRLQPFGAVAAVVALTMPEGLGAGAVATLWFAVCVCATAGGVVLVGRVVSGEVPAFAIVRWTLAIVTLAVALGFLSVGGTWLVISRLGLHPFDLSTNIVRLTAVHFHYAGFGLSLLAATGLAGADWMASRMALSLGSITSIAGPPIVAVGFVTDSALGQVGGAIVVTVAAWAVGFGTFLLATSNSPARVVSSWERGLVRGTGRMLLIVSSLSPLLPMLLAVQWALAQHWDVPALSVRDMANTHGVINGIGFVIAGLAGWLLAGVTSPETEPALTTSG